MGDNMNDAILNAQIRKIDFTRIDLLVNKEDQYGIVLSLDIDIQDYGIIEQNEITIPENLVGTYIRGIMRVTDSCTWTEVEGKYLRMFIDEDQSYVKPKIKGFMHIIKNDLFYP